MKKISLIALAFCTSTAVLAQDQPTLRTEMATKPYFGIKAGVNIAKLRIDDAPDVDVNSKTSLQGGFVAHFPISSRFAFQPELLYTGAGTKLSGRNDLTGVTETAEIDLHYLSLPLMFQIKPAGGFFLEFGPQVSYLMKATSDITGDDEDIKDGMETIDLALNGGIGYLSRVGLGINARYSHGLSKINEDDAGTMVGTKYKNQGIQVGLFYLFGAGR